MASAKKEQPGMESVYIVCQRCCQPLALHDSFLGVKPEDLVQLAEPLVAEEDDAKSSAADQAPKGYMAALAASSSSDGVIRRNVARMRGASTTRQDFALLTSPEQLQMGNLSYRLKVTSQLYDIMSGHGQVDHPLCQECTETMMDNMVKQLGQSEKELNLYQDYLAKMDSTPDEGEAKLAEELAKCTKEEGELLKRLKAVEAKRATVATESKALMEEVKQLGDEEQKYWKEQCEHQYQERALMDEQQSVDNQLQHAQAQLNILEKTNVYNAAFHIWCKGHFGTINGYRLGRLQTVPVEWGEINLAWGQAVLMLISLARRLKVRFERYRLIPYGNISYVETIHEKKKQLPLYCSGGLRLFWDTKFDNAMVAFLDLLDQFKTQLETSSRQDSSVEPFVLPYQINGDKIGDDSGYVSIKTQFNTDENWTKALKFCLTNLKWGLAYVTTRLNPHSSAPKS